MEEAIRLRLIEAIEEDLSTCESEISALAREALCSTTSAERRAEALIHRAEMQTRSVSLSRQLKRLHAESQKLVCVHGGAGNPFERNGCSESGQRCQWLRTDDLFRAS